MKRRLGRVPINAQIGGPLGGQSGKHLLILSLSAFDPKRTLTAISRLQIFVV